jgi:hypothetical protein
VDAVGLSVTRLGVGLGVPVELGGVEAGELGCVGCVGEPDPGAAPLGDTELGALPGVVDGDRLGALSLDRPAGDLSTRLTEGACPAPPCGGFVVVTAGAGSEVRAGAGGTVAGASVGSRSPIAVAAASATPTTIPAPTGARPGRRRRRGGIGAGSGTVAAFGPVSITVVAVCDWSSACPAARTAVAKAPLGGRAAGSLASA